MICIRLVILTSLVIPLKEIGVFARKLRGKKISIGDFSAPKKQVAIFNSAGITENNAVGDSVPYLSAHKDIDGCKVRLFLRETGICTLIVFKDIDNHQDLRDAFSSIKGDEITSSIRKRLQSFVEGEVFKGQPFRAVIGFDPRPDIGPHVTVIENYIKDRPSNDFYKRVNDESWRYISKRFLVFISRSPRKKKGRKRMRYRILQAIGLAIGTRDMYQSLATQISMGTNSELPYDSLYCLMVLLCPMILSGSTLEKSPLHELSRSLYRSMAKVNNLEEAYFAILTTVAKNLQTLLGVLAYLRAFNLAPVFSRIKTDVSDIFVVDFKLDKRELEVIEFLKERQQTYFDLIKGGIPNTKEKQLLRKGGGVTDTEVSIAIFGNKHRNASVREIMNSLIKKNSVVARAYRGPGGNAKSRLYSLKIDIDLLKKRLLEMLAN